jgi:hypothetical protein
VADRPFDTAKIGLAHAVLMLTHSTSKSLRRL